MQTKNILFISPTGTLDNGAEISIFNLMKELVRRGHFVHNIIPDYQVASQKQYCNELIKEGIQVHGIPALKWWWEDAPGGTPGTKEERIQFYRQNIVAIQNYIQQEEIDLVLTNTVNMFQGAVAAALEHKPHYWLIHEFPDNEFSYYKDKIDFIEMYADELFAVAGHLKKTLEKLFVNKPIKEFISFSVVEKTIKLESKKPRILSIGRVSERKNQLELIQAFEKLQRTDVELVFIGGADEMYLRKCQDYIKAHQLKNISFLGNQKNPWANLTTSDICVFPSAMETFGLVYVEAVLQGVPTILSNNPGHLSAYDVLESGMLYTLGNQEELVFKLNSLLDDIPTAYEEATLASLKAQKIYRVHNAYKELIECIESVHEPRQSSLRHLNDLLTYQETKTNLAKTEQKLRILADKIKRKLKK